MAGQIWEVVGGGDTGGVIVRISRERNAPQFPERLTSGSLVMGKEIVGDRLLYDRIAGTGYGPDSGWVCVRQGPKDLLIEVDVKPPKQGWKVLTAELPTYIAPPPSVAEAKQPSIRSPGGFGNVQYGQKMQGLVDFSPIAPIVPQTHQTPGEPYAFYHQISFNDTKGTGIRMSACLAAMDECRTDLFSICDNTVTSFRKVSNPFTSLALEMKPVILNLVDDDGLLYTHPRSTGPILSWLRLEAQFGWPMFPLRNEEQNIYFIGKDKSRPKQASLCTGRFQLAFTDDSEENKSALAGEEWEKQLDVFMRQVKSDHSSKDLDERQLYKYYLSAGKPFMPTLFKKVQWRMGFSFVDLWKLLFHAKTPEVLWEVNMEAGGDFAKLVEKEPDPQAMAVALPKPMEMGQLYDVYCFLEEGKNKALYLFQPEGSTSAADCVLGVVALYDWSSKCPPDGKTLRSEDLELITAPGRMHCIGYATGGEMKTTRFLDFEKLPQPS
eukprot:CAMPEP_0204604062 /NCGR_PEP_ID=MMETSP0661-20131031/57628_1 /ASSEMBLY_ACC=CAM_ASM_000606 /TAXON_ID=109239 /ORGANISM="Alexandrium margalefi, Strain AMGDE01CS-322" /LENGTH=493 /DNA_ID=CAMNT_0051615187 /DNA_START=62 /DNA_END=1543 /DNA_ORIENTATION=-